MATLFIFCFLLSMKSKSAYCSKKNPHENAGAIIDIVYCTL